MYLRTFVGLDMSRAIDVARNDFQWYSRAGVINWLISAWSFHTRFAVILIGQRSSVANVPCFKSDTPIRRPSRKEDALCSLAARACYLFTNKEENGWWSPVCNTVFVLRFMVKPARIYANVMPEPEGRAKKWRVIEERSRERTSPSSS